MSATGPSDPPPRRSSASLIVRPRTGSVPSRSNIRPLTHRPSAISVCPLRARLKRAPAHANAPSKRRSRSRICSHMGLDQDVRRPAASRSMTSWCGSRTGSVRRNRLSRIEKMAVFAPIPSARDSAATTVTKGVLNSVRKASWMLRMSDAVSGWRGMASGSYHRQRHFPGGLLMTQRIGPSAGFPHPDPAAWSPARPSASPSGPSSATGDSRSSRCCPRRRDRPGHHPPQRGSPRARVSSAHAPCHPPRSPRRPRPALCL